MSARAKLLSRPAAARAVRRAQGAGERVVLASGCFDLLHVGHTRSLAEARRMGDRLVVGVNADATVRRLKGGGRPILPARQRAELLAALGCVDWVVIFPEPTPRRLLAVLAPDVYAKGGDWPLEVLRAQDAPPGFRGRIRRLRQVPGVRTSAIVERIRKGLRSRSKPRRRVPRSEPTRGLASREASEAGGKGLRSRSKPRRRVPRSEPKASEGAKRGR